MQAAPARFLVEHDSATAKYAERLSVVLTEVKAAYFGNRIGGAGMKRRLSFCGLAWFFPHISLEPTKLGFAPRNCFSQRSQQLTLNTASPQSDPGFSHTESPATMRRSRTASRSPLRRSVTLTVVQLPVARAATSRTRNHEPCVVAPIPYRLQKMKSALQGNRTCNGRTLARRA